MSFSLSLSTSPPSPSTSQTRYCNLHLRKLSSTTVKYLYDTDTVAISPALQRGSIKIKSHSTSAGKLLTLRIVCNVQRTCTFPSSFFFGKVVVLFCCLFDLASFFLKFFISLTCIHYLHTHTHTHTHTLTHTLTLTLTLTHTHTHSHTHSHSHSHTHSHTHTLTVPTAGRGRSEGASADKENEAPADGMLTVPLVASPSRKPLAEGSINLAYYSEPDSNETETFCVFATVHFGDCCTLYILHVLCMYIVLTACTVYVHCTYYTYCVCTLYILHVLCMYIVHTTRTVYIHSTY